MRSNAGEAGAEEAAPEKDLKIGPAPALVEPRPVPRAHAVLLTLGGGVVTGALLHLAGIRIPGWGAGLVLALAAAAVWWIATLIKNRRTWEALTINTVQTKLRCQLRMRCRWRITTARRYELTYGQQAQLVLGDMLASKIVEAMQKATGSPVEVKAHKPRRRKLLLIPAAPPSAEKAAAQKERDRIERVSKQVFGPTAKLVDVTTGEPESNDAQPASTDGEEVVGFTIQHRVGARLVSPAQQLRVTATVSKMLPGRWRAHFDFEADTARFEHRPEFPKMIMRPVPPTAELDPTAIAQGVNEDGGEVGWDLGGAVAHFLRSGRTRSGKTVAMIGDAIEASRRCFQVFVIDPKRIEFLGMRRWPNVAMVATKTEDQIALLMYLNDLMYERYRLVEEEGADESEFHRILLVLDEYRILVSRISAWWKQNGGTGVCPAITALGDMLSLAAAARIHIELGTQRPDAELLGGDVRDNFSGRGAHGALSADGAKMMFGNAFTGTRINVTDRGRGTIISFDGNATETQYYYTPDPRKAHSHTPEETDLLARLRPAETTWPRQEFIYPTEEEIYQAKWEQAEAAHLAREAQAEGSRKTKPKAPDLKQIGWERIKQAKMVPWVGVDEPEPPTTPRSPERDAATGETPAAEEDQVSLEELFAEPSTIPIDRVDEGDLIDLEQDDRWTEVRDVFIDETDVSIEWAALDSDETGTVVMDTDTLVLCRKPESP